MRFPTEEEIKAVHDELLMSAELNHNHGNKSDDEDNDDCEMCKFMKEMSRRNEEAQHPCLIDEMVVNLFQQNPIALMIGIPQDIVKVVRCAFLVGYKAGINKLPTTDLESLFKE